MEREKIFPPLSSVIILARMRPFNEGRRPFTYVSLLLLLAVPAGFAVLGSGQQPPPAPPPGGTLRVEVEVVNIYCTVKDKKGRLVTDLEAKDFEIREKGKKQKLRYFARETDRPLTLALLVDTSISQKQVLPIEKRTAALFLSQILRPVDLVLLITFDVNVDLLQDFTAEAERVQRALNQARINTPVDLGPFPGRRPAGTRLYDAIYLAAKEKLAPEVGRKAIILVSDGVDAGSTLKEKQAIEAVQRSDTMIYAIGIADPGYYWQRGGRSYTGSSVLEKLAKETGGRAIFPSDSKKLQDAFNEIAAELRSQYSLGYTPTNRAHDGRFRKIKIKVKRKGLRVRARRGYYAPSS
ncbi:MAG: VWA domain-containing protein [Terriglobia bacterium]